VCQSVFFNCQPSDLFSHLGPHLATVPVMNAIMETCIRNFLHEIVHIRPAAGDLTTLTLNLMDSGLRPVQVQDTVQMWWVLQGGVQ
jgi:hypothetical protein